jgi:subtilisin family serine protease
MAAAPAKAVASDLVQELASFSALHRGIFVPRSDSKTRRQGSTVSRAAAMRSGLTYAEPPTSPALLLNKRGFVPASASFRERAKAPGAFEDLKMLGIIAASFRDPVEAEKVAAELDESYEFVADFPLRLPDPRPRPGNRLTGPEASERLSAAAWSEQSGIAEAHRTAVDGRGVLVGALDTGIDAGHAEFKDKQINFRYVSFYPKSPLWPPRDVFGFDTDLHGTHVSGILVGKTRGIVPNAKFYMASVIESETTLTSLTRVVDGLDWLLAKFAEAENKDLPAVVNISLGFPSTAPDDISSANYEARIRAVRYIIQDLLDANVLSIAAIGNSGEDTFGYPGAFGETLGVGAVDFDHKVAPFSGNRRHIEGPIEAEKPDLVGYGVDVYSSIERDYDGHSYYDKLDGTSMASPYVTGVAALYRSASPEVPAAEIRQVVLDNCLKLEREPSHRVGAGLARYREPDGIA